MKSKEKFIGGSHKWTSETPSLVITMEMDAHLSLDNLLSNFTDYLRAVGFVVDRIEVGFDEPEITPDYVGRELLEEFEQLT